MSITCETKPVELIGPNGLDLQHLLSPEEYSNVGSLEILLRASGLAVFVGTLVSTRAATKTKKHVSIRFTQRTKGNWVRES